jgi:hypothetical protein
VHPPANVQRVDLDVAQRFDRRLQGGSGFIQKRSPADKPSGFLD